MSSPFDCVCGHSSRVHTVQLFPGQFIKGCSRCDCRANQPQYKNLKGDQ